MDSSLYGSQTILISYRYKSLPIERGFYNSFFGPRFAKKNKPLPDYDTLIYNASLVLSNDYVGNGLITSVPQNFKFIGGYHIETPTKPVPTVSYLVYCLSSKFVALMIFGSFLKYQLRGVRRT